VESWEVLVLLWGFKLELKQSLRSKKFIATILIMMLLYVPFFYIIRQSGDIKTMTTGEFLENLVQFLGGMATFFIAILALLIGATSINSEIEKGTLRVAMSKPISRIGYIIGKMLAHITTLFIALLISAFVAIVGFMAIGAPVNGTVVREVILLNLLLLVGLSQLLLLGYLLSTLIKSSTTALGLALVLFFIISLIMPSVVTYMAFTSADHQNKDFDEVYADYATKYLFFEPTTQLKLIMSKVNEEEHMECYQTLKRVDLTTGEAKTLNKTRVETCNSSSVETYTEGNYRYYKTCTCEPKYGGIIYAVQKRKTNFLVLIGIALLYTALALVRFLRMDLR
jgi:ABC-2 type transport system permease protein